MSKELDNILIAIEKWVKKHKGHVEFVGSFHAFDEKKDFNIVDTCILGYGTKKNVQFILRKLAEEVKKEKDFVNW